MHTKYELISASVVEDLQSFKNVSAFAKQLKDENKNGYLSISLHRTEIASHIYKQLKKLTKSELLLVKKNMSAEDWALIVKIITEQSKENAYCLI